MFLTVLELEVWDQGASMGGWGCSSGSQTSHHVLMRWKPRGSSQGLFVRAPIPFMGAAPSWPNPPAPQRPRPWGLGSQHMNLGETIAWNQWLVPERALHKHSGCLKGPRPGWGLSFSRDGAWEECLGKINFPMGLLWFDYLANKNNSNIPINYYVFTICQA